MTNENQEREAAPIPMLLTCPECKTRHIDQGEWASKPHHTHACQHCGHTWRPTTINTVGVRYLPEFQNAGPRPGWRWIDAHWIFHTESGSALVWDNGVWHTFDQDGVGGENSSEASIAGAMEEAEKAIKLQGWDKDQGEAPETVKESLAVIPEGPTVLTTRERPVYRVLLMDFSKKAGEIAGIAEATSFILEKDSDPSTFIPEAVEKLKHITQLAQSIYSRVALLGPRGTT